jgi:four helix bundle protein
LIQAKPTPIPLYLITAPKISGGKTMNIALEKSKKFAIRTFNLYKYLCDEKREYVLSKQLLRSGTSIGANLSEPQYSVSKREFLVKTTISLKECAETEYWLDILKETGLLSPCEYDSMIKDCKDLLHILIATVKTTKQKINEKLKTKK